MRYLIAPSRLWTAFFNGRPQEWPFSGKGRTTGELATALFTTLIIMVFKK
jgi:hypothetical protein